MNKKRINDFLENIEYMYNIRYDTEYKMNDNEIYSWLVRLDDSSDHRLINNYFSDWINYFNNISNITCFCDKDNWPFFCQFQNGEWKTNDYSIKVYIPIKYNYIKEGVIELFSFLAKNNITHHSKVGSTMRNDNVVIRLKTIRDVKRLINYILDSEIKKHLLDANPFIFTYHKIGLAMDNNLSNNIEISKLIYNYILSRRLFKQADKPNEEEFCNFVYNCYKDTTDDSLKMIYDLLYSSFDKKYSIDDFYDKVSLYQGNVTLLFESLLATRRKFHDNEQAVNSLLMLLKGNYAGITRKNNYRKKLYEYMDSDIIRRTICNVSGFPKDSTINQEILFCFLKELNRYSLSGTLSRSIAYAVRVTLSKINKLNIDEATSLVKTYLETGNHYLITRDNGARELILSKTNKDDLINDLKLEFNEDLTIDELTQLIVSKIDFEEE